MGAGRVGHISSLLIYSSMDCFVLAGFLALASRAGLADSLCGHWLYFADKNLAPRSCSDPAPSVPTSLLPLCLCYLFLVF
jgi:hypothetical protein